MKILVVDTYYPAFLAEHYARAGAGTYEEQRAALLAARFGVSDSYSRNLRALGVEAEEIIPNAGPLQAAWAREHLPASGVSSLLPTAWLAHAHVDKVLTATRALLPILAAQIRAYRPDVLYLHDLNVIPPQLLRWLKRDIRLVVGQIACPLPTDAYLAPYDLILTSFPHYVLRLRDKGLAAEYLRLAFDPAVLAEVGEQRRVHACTFVGGISAAHTRGTTFLEHVARGAAIDFYGYGRETLPSTSAIRTRHHGPAWALDMYRVLGESHIALNRHVDVAESYANNMRLYEATGMGAMLLTDEKQNLGELFVLDREVVTYRNADEAVERIAYYTAHPEERAAIAKAGQQRTLREHTYAGRMAELVEILRSRL